MSGQRIGVVGLVTLGMLANVRAGNGQELRPNLVALPASEFAMSTNIATGVTRLRFAATSWNNGKGPMEIEAGATGIAGQDVYQKVYNSDGTFTYHLAGTYVYHPDHQHFHFENYALYTLKQVGAPGGSEKQSAKTSFCILDTTKVNTTLPGAPSNAVYTLCDITTQGMSVGWGDRYGPTLAGQSFDITTSPDGDYDLTINVDPQDRLLETSESDNLSCVRLHISVTNRTVQSLGACSSVTISSISPNKAAPDTTVDVTITGTGFTAGMAVGFENGTGPAPLARNVTFVNDTTYRASVIVKSGGGMRPRAWDVRVGSAVLPRGFTIAP
jgi:Lysyl oxidase